MRAKSGKKFVHSSFGSFRLPAHFTVCVDESADQPCPNRSLMITRVAVERRADIYGDVPRIFRRQRSQADRGEQFLFDFLQDEPGTLGVEHRMRQRDGKYL